MKKWTSIFSDANLPASTILLAHCSLFMESGESTEDIKRIILDEQDEGFLVMDFASVYFCGL